MLFLGLILYFCFFNQRCKLHHVAFETSHLPKLQSFWSISLALYVGHLLKTKIVSTFKSKLN
ncbi:hypothetical protein GLYMA_03G003200v4 [Glycine max]|uniref:Uncharacterized protein n=1 Tax=Glycine max TaxID=3847 RepID=A0A0R0KD04_SOYBN|nr:hypothetical protein JHK87_005795 [Glycine soja]KRH64892.1 hypothetical protein GLYMA_03G003200v4 [Glycine max]